MTPGAKFVLLGTLYLSQGLPFGFFSQALPTILRERGAELSVVGLSSLLALPWAVKFAWAPYVDRSPGVLWGRRLGRRKSWIVPLQATVVVLLAAAAFAPDQGALGALLTFAFGANCVAALQDTATDGLAVELLTRSERGMGNGVQVAGYRVGMILGGGGLLVLLARSNWRTSFLVAAAILALASVPVVKYDEPDAPCAERSRSGWLDGLHAPGMLAWIPLAAIYKFGDAMASAMVRPLLVDRGLTLEEIGWLLGAGGFTAGLLGALVGGWATGRIGRKRALLAFGLVQACAAGAYVFLTPALASMAHSSAWLWVVCSAEHFAGGMATAALFTVMMDRSRARHASTDYTLQASTVVIASGVAASASGFLAQSIGYLSFFVACGALSLAAATVMWLRFDGLEPVADEANFRLEGASS